MKRLGILVSEAAQYLKIPLMHATPYRALPQQALLFITQRCNSRCAMCGYWRQKVEPDEELSIKEIEDLLLQIKDMGIPVIAVSASGEVFAREDATDILRKIHEMGFAYSLNTNALAIDRKLAAEIAEFPPYITIIGIDTLKDKLYEKIRGIAGGATIVKEAIAHLQEAGYRDIAIGAVILKNNLQELIPLAQYVRDSKLRYIRYNSFEPRGFLRKWDSPELAEYRNPRFLSELRERINELIEFKRKYGIISNTIPFLKLIPNCFERKNFFPVPCSAIFRQVNIYPRGEVNVCLVLEEGGHVGNIREKSLKEIWFSPEAERIRNLAKRRECGGCWLSCYAEMNLRFSLRYGVPVALHSMKRFLSMHISDTPPP